MAIPKGYMSTKEAAERWGIEDERSIQDYLKIYSDKIGAIKAGRTKYSKWAIPRETQRPILKEDLLRFAQSLLRYKDNPPPVFSASSRQELLFNAMCECGYLMCANESEPQSAWSYRFTDEGFDFVFNGRSCSKGTLYVPPPVSFKINVNFELTGFLSFMDQVRQWLS